MERKAGKKRVPSVKKQALSSPAASAAVSSAAWMARDKHYTDMFGALVPKGRVLSLDGTPVKPQLSLPPQFDVAQYGPRADRMSWVYITHGFSSTYAKKSGEPRVELMVQWRHRDAKVPVHVLARAAQHIQRTGKSIPVGEVLTAEQIGDSGVVLFPHWIVSVPDKSIPATLKVGSESVRLMQLVGVTDAEYQVALKVNPELADARQVLLEALRGGGVYPVTDPLRTCLTRRRDFLRIWEGAFRVVRERAAKAAEQ